jgi:DNA-binding MarR family transcriptional regulator
VTPPRRRVLTGDVDDYRDEWGASESLQALRDLTDAATATRPALARRAGMSHSELVALEHLFAAPLGPAEVARRLGVTTAASTSIIDRLVERGHVRRTPHPTDRRRTEVELTDSGRREVLTHLMPMFQELEALDHELTDEERAVVTRYLRRATRALRLLTLD